VLITAVDPAAVPSPSRANCGVLLVAMLCGVERVIVPAPLVTTTWLEVPVIVAYTKVVPLPMGTWPFVGAPLPPVPPLAAGQTPVTPLVRLTWAHAGLFEVPVFERY